MLRTVQVAGILVFGTVLAPAQPSPTHESASDFQEKVLPVFAARCQMCHGDQQQMAGLRLNRADESQAKVIAPGNSAASKLYERIASDRKGHRMPPAGDALNPAEIAAIKSWIDKGAVWPAQAEAKPVSKGLWSFQPVRRLAAPAIKSEEQAKNAVDRFILARLEKEGIQPSPEADRNTLIRRASLDLTGLPPSPQEVASFLADARPGAYERMLDRFLASPHYGERWARQWLDLAHYADSDGYEKDLTRPHAWRYRHWVIDAFNRDMPFDQFTIEQLAGDLLPNPSTGQRVATGFLRQTLTNREAGVDRGEARFEQLVNRTNTVSTVFLGLTTGCAQCHNHKYDPISRKDYYRMLAYFHTAEEEDIEAPLSGESGAYLRALADFRTKEAAILAEYDVDRLAKAWVVDARRAFFDQGKDLEWDFAVTSFRAMFDSGDRFLKEERHAPATWARFIRYFVKDAYNPRTLNDKPAADRLKEARTKLAELDASLPPYSQAMAMREVNDLGPAHDHPGGDHKSLGEVVTPGTLSSLPDAATESSANRLTLARWITSKDNPLTARVAMNRLWQELFGAGLSRTSEDFGTQGERPTHPELLDWLATEFMDRGWSWREMLRLVMTSATYRQSSNARPELDTRDPANTLLARQNRVRLTAEAIRDSALAASGLLSPEIGGRSVKPPQPPGIAELVYGAFKWNESEGMDRYRRGMYIHYQRTAPYPLLASFDAPDASVACSRRRRSNSPLQALNLLNDVAFVEAAQTLAVRVYREAAPTATARIERAFELSLARKPSAKESERLNRFFTEQLSLLAADPKAAKTLLPAPPAGVDAKDAAAMVAVSRVLLNLDEFITRE